MKVLFLTLANIDPNSNGLYMDLLRELRKQGHDVFVVYPNEKRMNGCTILSIEEDITYLRVKTGNITKTSFIEKGIATLMIEKQFISAIDYYYNDIVFDLVLYTTPPVTFEKVIRYIKEKTQCKSYLILKDIFPQNAADLEIIKKKGIIYKYFRIKEKKLYEISDYIGCTSKGNIEYIKRHNPEINTKKIELFPNSILPRQLENKTIDKKSLREKFGIPNSAVVFVYGGNIGRPQGIDFIKDVIKKADDKENLFFMILGSGTDFDNLSKFIADLNIKNVSISQSVSNDEYWRLLSCCDVGLIFLDNRFTVPNTPARLTYYMEAALPILAATDKNTDIDLILEEANCGKWIESGDVEGFYTQIDLLMKNKEFREQLGSNGREYMEKNLNVGINCKTLLYHLGGTN